MGERANNDNILNLAVLLFLQSKFTESVSRSQSLTSKIQSDPQLCTSVTCVEQLTYEYALLVGREAAVDELLGNHILAYQRYEVCLVLLELIGSWLTDDDADRAAVAKYVDSFVERQRFVARKILTDSNVL